MAPGFSLVLLHLFWPFEQQINRGEISVSFFLSLLLCLSKKMIFKKIILEEMFKSMHSIYQKVYFGRNVQIHAQYFHDTNIPWIFGSSHHRSVSDATFIMFLKRQFQRFISENFHPPSHHQCSNSSICLPVFPKGKISRVRLSVELKCLGLG